MVNMKPPPFDYVAPPTVNECLEVLASREDAQVLAGGQSLLPVLALRLASPSVLVDVTRVKALRQLRVAPSDTMVIGAAVRQSELEDHPDLARANPLVARAVTLVGHRSIRTRGTVGGSVAHADPAAEWPALLTTLDARVTVQGPAGTRALPASDFFLGPFMTARTEHQIVTEVALPAWPTRRGAACREFARRDGDFALVGLMVTAETAGGRPLRLAITAFGGLPRPLRLHALEQRLLDLKPKRWQAAISEAVEELPWGEDIHASGALRRHVARSLAGAAVHEAIRDAAAREAAT